MSHSKSTRRDFLGRTWRLTLGANLGLVGLSQVGCARETAPEPTEPAPKEPLATEWLGGRKVTPEELKQIHNSPYMLHVKGGELNKVEVEKNLLPHDPEGHVQGIVVAKAPRGTIYVKQRTLWCKSEDGGKSWAEYPREGTVEESIGFFNILSDGRFVGVPNSASGERTGPVEIHSSDDQGRTWNKLSEIGIPQKYHSRYVQGLCCLRDDTLLLRVQLRDLETEEEGWKWISGSAPLFFYRSTDQGESWEEPVQASPWGSEGGTARMASGKLLATIRYQRPLLPDDPPDLIEKTGSWNKEATGKLPTFPYKHVFLADSTDEGRSWKNLRQLTTAFGQCYGYPGGLSDGTAVVLHDHRYPSELCTGRAMVSPDEGKTWNDEVYYTHYGLGIAGYNQTVVLEDDVMLTVAGTCDELESRGTWSAAIGKSDIWAIRWKLV